MHHFPNHKNEAAKREQERERMFQLFKAIELEKEKEQAEKQREDQLKQEDDGCSTAATHGSNEDDAERLQDIKRVSTISRRHSTSTTETAPTAPKPFRLMDLARELRDNIYEKVIEDASTHITLFATIAVASPLIRANRQIHNEFLDIIHLKAETINVTVRNFDFHHVSRFIKCLSDAHIASLAQNNKSDRKILVEMRLTGTTLQLFRLGGPFGTFKFRLTACAKNDLMDWLRTTSSYNVNVEYSAICRDEEEKEDLVGALELVDSEVDFELAAELAKVSYAIENCAFELDLDSEGDDSDDTDETDEESEDENEEESEDDSEDNLTDEAEPDSDEFDSDDEE